MSHPSAQSSPAWSFTSKTSKQTGQGNPGPGAYSYSERRSIKTAKFGTGQRRGLSDPQETPGPGSYTHNLSRDYGLLYTIKGGKDKMNKSSSETSDIGPCSYSPKEVGKEPNISYSMPRKKRDEIKSLAPGPGEYRINADLSKQGTRIGNAHRLPKYETPVPGPGQYSRRSGSGAPMFGFGTQNKGSPLHSKKDTPGPGSYNTSAKLNPVTTTMTPRRPDMNPKLNMTSPGPGAYSSPMHKKRAPSFSLGTSQRSNFNLNGFVPGPGNYSPNNSRKPGISFGTSARPSNLLSHKTPGPGSYVIPNKMVEGPEFSIAKNWHPDGNKGVPGPGSYSPRSHNEDSKANIRFGKEKRSSFDAKNVPGPGEYELNRPQTEGPKWAFGVENRTKDPKSETPGFCYEVPPTIPNVAPYNLKKNV